MYARGSRSDWRTYARASRPATRVPARWGSAVRSGPTCMRAFGNAAWLWQPMQPFVVKRRAPRLVETLAGWPAVRSLVVAELAVLCVSGARLAAVSSTAKVPYAASSAIDRSIGSGGGACAPCRAEHGDQAPDEHRGGGRGGEWQCGAERVVALRSRGRSRDGGAHG